MHKIGIIIALKEEINSGFFKQWKLNKDVINYYIFKNKETVYFLVFSGVGKVNAAITTSFLINNLQVERIINLGSVGAINHKAFTTNNICLVNEARYGDVDISYFGYEIGQIPKSLSQYHLCSRRVAPIRHLLINKFGSNQVKSKIKLLTSDYFITPKNKNKLNQLDKVDIVDMEAAAICQTAHKFKFNNLIVIKIVSDNTNDQKNKWDNNINQVSVTIADILNLIIH